MQINSPEIRKQKYFAHFLNSSNKWKIVGAEHKILATKHKNSNKIPDTSCRIQKFIQIQNKVFKTEITLTKYENTLHSSKIVLTELEIVGSEDKILTTKHKNSKNTPILSCRIQKVLT